jgi:hypothetical protein
MDRNKYLNTLVDLKKDVFSVPESQVLIAIGLCLIEELRLLREKIGDLIEYTS